MSCKIIFIVHWGYRSLNRRCFILATAPFDPLEITAEESESPSELLESLEVLFLSFFFFFLFFSLVARLEPWSSLFMLR